MEFKTLSEQIKFAESIPISTDDLRKITNNETAIWEYHQLADMRSIDELFVEHESAIILYELQGDIGHFIAVIRDIERNYIRHYDSYKLDPDEEINLFKHKVPYYSQFLYTSYYGVDLNNHQHQQYREAIQTCGRHSALRCIYKHLTNDEYHKFISSKPTIHSPDELVSVMTMASLHYATQQ